jgi:hypothetical protein
MLPFGLRDYRNIGSIAGGSNVLHLRDASIFTVGDQLIVEVGGEIGGGKLGTLGVGGIIPAARDAWSTFYYRSKDVPLALVAKVTAVTNGGRTLTLDRSAIVGSIDADVYFDNAPLLNAVLAETRPAGWIVNFPAGDFAVSEVLRHESRTGWLISGAGRHKTIFRSPKGVAGSGLKILQSPVTHVRDFSIVGNARQEGFAFKEWGSGIEYGCGVLVTRSDNCVIEGVSCTDVFRKAAWVERSKDVQITNCLLTMTDAFRGYLEWWFGASDSERCTLTQCVVDSKYLVGAFESFRSNGVKFVNCRSRNGTFSSNSSGNFLLVNFSLTVAAGSQFDDVAFHHLNPMVNINSNIQPPNAATIHGGMIRNVRVVSNYINVNNDQLCGISVTEQNPNIRIEGGHFYYENYAPPSELPGACAVNSLGANTRVSNLAVVGTINRAKYPGANISVTNGTVDDCEAALVKVAGVVQ